MSYRKKHYPPKPERTEQAPPSVTEYKNPGVLKSLSTSRLTSGELPYQRPVVEKDVDALIRKWNLCALEPIVVSFRDGHFYVVDGQHRIAAMKKMNGGKDVMVNCIIHTGMIYEDEAALCHDLDQAKKAMTLGQSTHVDMESGKGVEALEIRRLVEEAGFMWALEKRSDKEYVISATRAVINSYRLLGGSAFSRMLALINRVWHGDPVSLSAAMLSGMALFIKTYEVEMNDHTFVKRLSVVAPDEIILRGKIDFSTNSVALRHARVIWDKYNSGRGGRKLPYRFVR